jgi:hypothetical protein
MDNKVVNIIKQYINLEKEKTQLIKRNLVNKNKMTASNFKDYQLGKNFENIDEVQLCILFNEIKNHFNIGNIENYFDISIINQANDFKLESENKIEFPLVFKNVVELAENQYSFPLSVSDIANLKNENILEIIPELQRETGKTDKVKVNLNRAKEIAEKIKNGNYKYNTIRINLMNEDGSLLNYNKEQQTLSIESGRIICLDGNHRATGCILANDDIPNIEEKFNIVFTYFNEKEARATISQEWNTESVSQRHKESMKQSNANDIIGMIRRNDNAEPLYKDKIVTHSTAIQRSQGFILSDILASAIEKEYETNNFKLQSENKKVADWLVEFFNELTAILQDDFYNFKTVKKDKWSVNPYAFVGYVYLSKVLKDKSDWETLLKNIISNIDFTNSNYITIKSTMKKENMAVKKYFENEVLKYV